ncbi:MAG: UDP-N-acetylmuramoyl-L-alanyl-D-glutamate--2,6-diaminopimelate ligase [Deltaproteobacteria bacterium]|nr:UDP-N-acetylmuramoyl-L-alanyl-D-glutamate--2,6-diaminopimelate ligase [Deltaproteobacteria bacterium]
MRLRALASILNLPVLGDGDPEIVSLVDDSRTAGPGSLFAAVRGGRTDGHAFAQKAFAAGAEAALVSDARAAGASGAGGTGPGRLYLVAPEDGFRKLVSRAAGLVYGSPQEKTRLLAVTGTNGKTSTTYVLERMLGSCGVPCGVVGTVDYRWPGGSVEAPNTTPEGPLLWRTLGRMVGAGVGAVVMEASSHALELGRLGDLRFDLALFTNLTRDHLDFHADMEAYFRAKRRLFAEALKPGGAAVVCGDDPYGRRLLDELRAAGGPGGPGVKVLSFGFEPGNDFLGSSLSLGRRGFRMEVASPGNNKVEVACPMLGGFNAMNVLGSLAAASALGVGTRGAARSVRDFPGAPGRLRRVGRNDDYLVLVDYSHTPDALRSALLALRELGPSRLLCVFGCGGDRDKGKRPLMGAAAGELSDLAVLTSDNPRTEDPMAIIGDVRAGLAGLGLAGAGLDEAGKNAGNDAGNGIGKSFGTYLVEPDRGGAIEAACGLMGAGDVLLIAGKGHESYQIVGTEKRHFDDAERALAALEALGRA